jgi:hypothetical protein
MLPFVLENGLSTFILMTDDPREIELWGGEVAPALRELVATDRARPGNGQRDRGCTLTLI